jgi:hypothetical protein
MLLDVILRTHDQSSLHDWNPRVIDVPKPELIRRCVISLVNALTDIDHTLTILDDHSSDETIDFLSRQETVIPTGPGNNASLFDAVELAGSSRADLVYMVEDDYLHSLDAVQEMLAFIELAKVKGLPTVAVHPYDDHDSYTFGANRTSNIVVGPDRHWRTNDYSTATVMAEPWVFREPEWEVLAQDCDKPGKNIDEGTTISKIWKERLPLFTPLPSLAIHVNGDIPPLVDFQQLWEQNTLEKDYVRPRLCAN